MDFTEGNIKKILIRFSIPIILSLIAQQLYNVADAVIVGRFLGAEELSAVGNGGAVIGVLITISGGLEMGSEVIFSKYAGQKKYKDILSGIKSILIFGFICGIIISVTGIITAPIILKAVNVPDNLMKLTSSYLTIYMSCLMCIFVYDISRAVIMAMGDSKTPMIMVIATSCINITLDLLFICIFNMGVAGAALATALSQVIGAIVTLYIMKQKIEKIKCECGRTSYDGGKIKEILSISLPTIFQQLVLSLSSLILQSLVNPFGTDIISGYVALNKIMYLGMLPVIGFCQTLSMFASANSGYSGKNRVAECYKTSIIYASICTAAVVLINFILPKYLIGSFIDINIHKEAFIFAKDYLQFSTVVYFITAYKNLNESVLRGYGRMKEFLCSNITDLIVKVVSTYILIKLIASSSFWIGNMCGRIASFAISSFILYKVMRNKSDN